jgi:hypothetical protein
MAARTNKRLQKAMGPLAERYFDDISALAYELLPELARALGEYFPIMVSTIIAVFDGEVVHRFMLRKPVVEEARLQLLLALTRDLVARAKK